MLNLKKISQGFWFIGGFAVGMTLISIGNASLPSKVTQDAKLTSAPKTRSLVTEINPKKAVLSPDLEQDYSKLNQAEAKFAESWEQQQKLKEATLQASGKRYAKAKLIPQKVIPAKSVNKKVSP